MGPRTAADAAGEVEPEGIALPGDVGGGGSERGACSADMVCDTGADEV